MISNVLIYITTAVITFVLMEGVAWFLHKYVMHGFGWYLHEDHHRPRKKRFEKNDVFGLFFAAVSFLLIITWVEMAMVIGIGIAFYGLGYFMVHDVFFHKRIKIRYRPKHKYIRRILNAHATHHQISTSDSGVCFGFLYANKKYAG